MPESLFVVTNRAFRRDREADTHELRDGLNPKGARELRLFEARPRGDDLERWRLDLVPDGPRRSDFEAHGVEPHRKRPRGVYSGSDLVLARVVARLRAGERNLLLFVHGYNNNVEDALGRAWRLARRYDLEVIVFSWPANDGGSRFLEDLHGLASYRSDKADARASTEALDRAFGRMQILLGELNEGFLERAREEAMARHPGNPDERRAFVARHVRERACPFNVSLLAHSMGNYLLKKTLLASDERLSLGTVFDNVVLKAADTNHAKHDRWVERLRARRRVYVTVNREDRALALSTMKVGDAQEPRLGNTLRRQDAANATYIDFSDYLGDEHSYFEAADVAEPPGGGRALEAFFGAALNGRVAEEGLAYRADTNTYRLA